MEVRHPEQDLVLASHSVNWSCSCFLPPKPMKQLLSMAIPNVALVHLIHEKNVPSPFGQIFAERA